MKRRRLRGFTLIEVLVVIGIMSAAAVATIAYLNRTTQENDTQRLVSLVREMIDRTRLLYADDPRLYSDLTMYTLVSAGVFESSQLLNAFFVSGPADSRIRISPIDRGGIPMGGFQVRIVVAPRPLCVGVARMTADLVTEVSINGTQVSNTATNDAMTSSEAGTLCQATGNTVILLGS